MNVNLKLLQSFLLVAEYRSFRRAAKELHRSEPAVSMQIRQLEHQLAITLFHRTTRRVELTKEGEVLLAAARRAQAEIDTGLKQIEGAVRLKRERITIAVSHSIAAKCLPLILTSFRDKYPDIDIYAYETMSGEMSRVIKEQKADFGVGFKVDSDPDLHFEPVFDEETVAVLPVAFGGNYTEGIEIEEFLSFPLILARSPNLMRDDLQREASNRGLTLNPRYEVSQLYTMLSLVSAGLGVSIFPRLTVTDHLIGRSVLVAPFLDAPIGRQYGILTLRSATLAPAVLRLKELAAQVIGQTH